MRWIVLLLVASTAIACSSDVAPTPGGLGEGCPGAPALAELSAPPAFAVVLSDFSSTAIAILDANGQVLNDRWLDSGTRPPGLVAALSGDVVFPSTGVDGSLLVIDRFRTDVVSRFCLQDGSIVGQLRTHGEAVTGGFSSNPQDLLALDNTAWVSRYESNLQSGVDAINRGNDLFELDLRTMTHTGRTVDLTSLNGRAMNPAGENLSALARPVRLVRTASGIAVGLDRLSPAFDAAGEGALALVDPDAQVVSSVTLPGFQNCGQIVPAQDGRVLVACAGFASDFCDAGARSQTAGLVIVDPATESIEQEWRASGTSIPTVEPLVLPDGSVLAGAAGACDGTSPDRLVRVDLNSGAETVIYEGSGSFTLGRTVWQDNRVLLPDSEAGVVAFTWTGTDLENQERIVSTDAFLLPPRQIGVLSP
ncbi:MAG: hypothetical protein AAGF12_18355 [Myxococcota bacterium]